MAKGIKRVARRRHTPQTQKDLTWINRTKRGYAAKHGGRSWKGERVLTAAEATTIIENALRFMRREVEGVAEPDGYNNSSGRDLSLPGGARKLSNRDYAEIKADHLYGLVQGKVKEDGAYAVALRIELSFGEWEAKASKYIEYRWAHYQGVHWSEVYNVIVTAVMGEEIGRTLRVKPDMNEYMAGEYEYDE